MGAWLAAQLDAYLFQTDASARLESAARAAAEAPARAAPAIATPRTYGDLVGRIEIPRLGVSAIIANDCENRTLMRAVGHIPGSALPGETGNVCLAGHRDTFFRGLREIEEGDSVRITTPYGRFDYAVSAIDVVSPSRVDLLRPTRTPTLTLVTCYPFDFIGSAPERFIVRARHIQTTPPSL
jgi:sortase A